MLLLFSFYVKFLNFIYHKPQNLWMPFISQISQPQQIHENNQSQIIQ